MDDLNSILRRLPQWMGSLERVRKHVTSLVKVFCKKESHHVMYQPAKVFNAVNVDVSKFKDYTSRTCLCKLLDTSRQGFCFCSGKLQKCELLKENLEF